ncbi:MAG: PPC domain-containing protein [Promethearchaeota archaeon]
MYFRFFAIAWLAFGLLASLAYPTSPAPTAAAPSLPPILQEPLQISSPQNFDSLPLSRAPFPNSDINSNSTAKLNVSSSNNAPLTDGSVLYGPHVIINGTWNPLDIPGFPTIKIQQTCLDFIPTVHQEHYGTITGPVLAGWHPDHNPREGYDYVYLEEDDNVYVEVEFGTWSAGEGSTLIHGPSDDLDIFVWSPGVNHTYANSLGYSHGGNPETVSFRAPVTGTYTIGLDYYSGVVPMGWRSYIFVYRVFRSALFDGRSAEYDTADIGFNGVFDVRLRLITGTTLDLDDSFSSRTIRNVEIINFFPPNVTVLKPGAGPNDMVGPGLVTINWTGSDLNTDEVLQYSVEISNDLGKTWKVIAYTTRTSTIWDPDSAFYGLPPTPYEADGTLIPNFLVRVNVTDGRFHNSDVSDNAWSLLPLPPLTRLPLESFVILVVGAVVFILIAIDAVVFLYRRTRPRKKHQGDDS